MNRRAFIFALSASVSSSDAFAQIVNGSQPGNRVVCVSKQINEFIFDIGAEEHLVARDLTSIYPPQITRLPNVGYHRALSAEGIVSMRPSAFLTDGNVGPNEVLDRIKSVGIPVVTMDPGNTVQNSEKLLSNLGKYFGRSQQADAVLRTMQTSIEKTIASAKKWDHKNKPKVLMMHFGQIGNSYLGLAHKGAPEQILEWAGGENAITTAKDNMSRLTPEIIASAAPDIIIATDVGYDRYGSAEAFAQMPGINLTPAGKALRIHRLNETEIMYFGPRTANTVTTITRWLHDQA